MESDLLSKVRALLSFESSRKRKSSEEYKRSFELIKKSRMTGDYCIARLFEDDVSDKELVEVNKFHRRRTDPHNFKMGQLFSKKTNHYSPKVYSADDDDQIVDQIDLAKQKQSALPALQRIGNNRSVPPLVKADWHSSRGTTIKPANSMMSSRSKISRIPELHPIQKNNYPTSSLTDGTSNSERWRSRNNADSHLNNNHTASSWFKSTFMSKPVENGLPSKSANFDPSKLIPTPNRWSDRSVYSNLCKLLWNKPKSKDSGTAQTASSPQEFIDLLDDNDDTKLSASNTTIVEPVNSLLTKFEGKEVYQKDWLSDLNQKYSGTNADRSEIKLKGQTRNSLAESERRKHEDAYIDRLQKIAISGDEFVFELPEDEPEEEYVEFPQLTQEHLQRLCGAMQGRDGRQIVVSKFNLSITKDDLRTLNWEPPTWLNDEVINFYMELLAERSRQNEKLPKVYAQNTFFLKRLYQAGYSGVKRWTRKVDIFSYDIMVVPVHKDIHWCMAIVHLKNKTIKYYDSMGTPNHACLNALEVYLKEECAEKKKQPLDMTGWSKENVQGIPQQENGSDCGVFSCMYAEYVARNRPITFSQQNMQYFRMKMVFEISTGQLML